jgi:ATP-dependent Lhr-like helicase
MSPSTTLATSKTLRRLSHAFTVVKRWCSATSRSSAEQLSSMLRGKEVRTFVSHASLSVSERRQAEAAFGEEKDCVIVATSTLELGIDVGDLDRVIQIDSPSTVSSFLQRMGRTGRRSGSLRNCLFLTTNQDAFMLALGVTHLWSRAGWRLHDHLMSLGRS